MENGIRYIHALEIKVSKATPGFAHTRAKLGPLNSV